MKKLLERGKSMTPIPMTQEELKRRGRLFVSDESGQPIAVILPISEYERLQRLDVIENSEWLSLAESSFSFWDNDKDALYDNL
jgi:hypothetical protein